MKWGRLGKIWRKVLAFGHLDIKQQKKIEEFRRIRPNLDDFDPNRAKCCCYPFVRGRVKGLRALHSGDFLRRECERISPVASGRLRGASYIPMPLLSTAEAR